MTDEIREKLDEEIESQIEAMSHLVPGSEEQAKAAKNVAELIKLDIEADKNRHEAQEHDDARYSEDKFHEAQLAEQRKARWLQFGAAAAGILLEMVFYGYWLSRGYKYEEDGVVTSPTLKDLIRKMRPPRR